MQVYFIYLFLFYTLFRMLYFVVYASYRMWIVLNWIYLQAEGKRLGLVGWVLNTEQGTVRGQLQGPGSKVKEMQDWLRNKGSPKSKITKAEFSNEKEIESLEHSDFRINKQKKV